MKRLAFAALLASPSPAAASAQTVDLGSLHPRRRRLGDRPHRPDRGILTVLSVAPGLLVMVTSFTRFIIAFSFLRSGLGLQTTPPT